MRPIILTYFCLLPVCLKAGNDSLLVRSLLRDIASMQQVGDGFYAPGSFPSARVHGSRPDLVNADNNIFFTGLIGVGLQSIRTKLSGDNRRLCDSILRALPAAYAHYRNRDMHLSYNFWPTDHPKIFPGDVILSHLTKTHSLPDDSDDTAVILSSEDSVSDEDAKKAKALMEAHAGGSSRSVHNYYAAYRHVPVYTTWFGKRMPLDIDFSVECNILYWVGQQRLPLSGVDSATIGMLRDMIHKGLVLSDPAYLSPHYARTPVLLYQISRLVEKGFFPGLDSLKPLLINQTEEALRSARGPMDSLLLASSLIRLGVPPSRIPTITFRTLSQDDAGFFFFIGTFSDYFPNPLRRIFLHTQLVWYGFQCVAYNRFLVLEYVLLSQGREA